MKWPKFLRRGKRTATLPPSADPLDFADDRGPAKYFHGRVQLLDQFATACRSAESRNGGTIFLVQGPPGAGKTALLHECAGRAGMWGWKTIEITHDAFWNPSALHHAFKPKRRRYRIEGASASGGVPGIANLAIFGSKHQPDAHDLLQLHAGRARSGILLILDEAQLIGNTDLSGGALDAATKALQAIHNGKLDHPVILLAGGLSGSAEAFRKFGISRFVNERKTDLGRLEPDAARAVVRDWLQMDGKAKEDVRSWVNAIAEESYGWPQHIMVYVKPAVLRLRADGGLIMDGGLPHVLMEGRQGRERYYQSRAEGLTDTLLRALIGSLANGACSEVEILASLGRDYAEQDAKAAFALAVEKGVVAQSGNFDFDIPIPSMRDWMKKKFLN